MARTASDLPVTTTRPRRAARRGPSRWMTWPMVIYLVVVTQVPFLLTIWISLQSWNLQYPDRGVRFVGLANFANLLDDSGFRESIANTALFTLAPAVLTAAIGLGLALLLNRMRFGRSIAYGLLLMPFLVMETVSPIIWKTMILSPLYGVLTWVMAELGLPPVDFLAAFPRSVIITMVVWQWTPFMMMILLAGLQSVPQDQIEAAQLDGASALRRFTAIVMPHLQPLLTVGVLLEIILILPLFGPIYVATYGGPGEATTNLMFSAYRVLAEQYEVGRAAAAGLIAALLTVGVSLALSLALAIPAAYRLAFFPGGKAKDLLFFALSTRFMPGVATIVPIILIFARIGLLDSYTGLVVLYTALDIPLVLWLMRAFFRDIPFEIIEASLMDGASHARILLRIVLPLARGGLVTTCVLITILAWNEFFIAVNVTGRDTATLPVYMASFLTTEGMGWAPMAAALTLAILPVIALGLSTSRSLVRGLVAGAVK